MKTHPKDMQGFEILQGSRSAQSIIKDMQAAYCNGQMLLKKMNEGEAKVQAGTLLVEVAVEYTGEVISVRIVQTEIQSEKFQRLISDFIMNSDFASWRRADEDTVFIYPLAYTEWWR